MTFKDDTWLYRGDEARLFVAGEAFPGGDWSDAPGVPPSPLDHDGDGKPGGSKPRGRPRKAT